MKIKKTEVTNSSIPIPNGFKQTDIGLIPEEWECKFLKDVIIKTVTRNPSVVHPDKYIKYVDVSSISNENYKIISDQFVKGSEAPGRARKVIQTNDTIFATIRPTLKRIAKVNSNYNDEYCSTAFCVLRPDQDLINKDFLYYNMLTDLFIEKISKHQSGASYPAVRDDNVKDMAIPLPKIPEQKKIAHVLSKIQQAIETQEQVIKTTQELKKALMQKLFTEGLNGEPQKQTEIGPIPESWGVRKLGEIIEATLYGLSIKGKQEGKYPALRMTNQYDGKTILENLQYVDLDIEKFEKFKLNKEDILFNRTNSIDLVGKTSIFESDIEAVFFSYLIRIKTKRNILNPFYLNYFLNLQSTQRNLKKLATRGVSQSNISATRLKTFLIPFPSIERQIEIVAMIKVFDHKIDLEKDRLKNMRQLLSNMLNQLMTGQIRVKDIEFKLEETAEAVEGV